MALRTLFKSEGTEKEGEEKNSSSTQAKGGRREKSLLTTQENFWCEKKWGKGAQFIGEEPKISYKSNG